MHAPITLPSELTLSALNKELKTLTKPIPFGVSLGVPQERLEIIQQDNRFGELRLCLSKLLVTCSVLATASFEATDSIINYSERFANILC